MRRKHCLATLAALLLCAPALGAPISNPEIGIAVRDVSPELPIRLAGYAGRKRAAEKSEHPLLVQALAFKNSSGERFVLVALDNCEVSREFMEPVLQQLSSKYQLARGETAVVSSHTHSAPILEHTLTSMAQTAPPEDQKAIAKYSRFLREKLVEVVGAALANCQPGTLEYGLGRASFAMNRRVYQGDTVVFGENLDGPADWDVPVLRIKGTNGSVRAVLFGYACHGTSVQNGDDWYTVCGDYMAYARHHLEAHEPGAVAIFLTGMGADLNPSPRGSLLDAKRHGLELAGSVVGVLKRPMRPVTGPVKFAYEEVDLPLVTPPTREKLEQDSKDANIYIKARADAYLSMEKIPTSVSLPIAAVRLGDGLTFVLMGGEVVVDYSRRIKRLFAADHPWTIGYAYEVPCYIPSARIIKEGGYEADSSLIYYGYYGPFRGSIENQLIDRLGHLMTSVRTKENR